MKQLIFLLFTLSTCSLIAQTTISGKVTDNKGVPISGANVYLNGTYDGTATINDGTFKFTTEEIGEQTLIISFVSFESYSKTDLVKNLNNLQIKLKEDVNTLDAVIVNAGSFKAGENAKVTALKPLDVVTTAGAMGDFIGALQTLPGTSNVAEDGRLFVRGGDAEETQIFVDGMRVFTPYSPTANNIPTRGRLSPFLFKGITFSTGGYSAEYGQALSSVLLLNSIDEPDEERTDISLMTVGLGVGNTQKWEKNSLSVNASYINLQPYQELYPDNNEWHRPVQSLGGEAVYRHKINDNGLLKLYGAFSALDFDLTQEDINIDEGVRFGMKNRNLYFNASYKDFFKNDWSIQTGLSYANDYSDLDIVDDTVQDTENSAHFKIKLSKFYNSRFRLNFGSEYFITNFNEDYINNLNQKYNLDFSNNIAASFAETNIFFSKKLAANVGLRAEYSSLFKDFTISPRASIAYKSGQNSQVSLAYGQFYQNPKNDYLKFNTNFSAQNTTHLIANYQYVKNKQIFRAEAYYKDYNSLVKYNTEQPIATSNYSNNGSGFAKGLDLFWRDNKSIKNTEYWVSYSYLDTERDYKNYPTKATPSFASQHNASLVLKHFISDLKSQVGISYNFASGRNYTDPNKSGFLNSKTKNYNAVNANWAYLINQQKILYFSVSNVFGTQNVNGYQFKNQLNSNGVFESRTIRPAADRFFFVGFFWTISDNKKDNQLDNL
ncbi:MULTISPECIES: TonB-dependent receptor [unclassified Cellulophaga]|uniref:TonB-dependent receptor n=1 Tax=unclassified Cellulophaga TaxID=2634405 RepID=UPI0026E2F8C1|nr:MULTISPECIES: TonB-dependent receptor [unclassified Cellulophaga]MDO6491603.1 TonB-dependent receptor [Cellulophaga sp. 2_MG-2023]MDO6493480.1 TonB-dependent receptor [Cellulophaga sp. 3_MG-2023]